MVIDILKMIGYTVCTYILLSVGCEYRNYRGGHRYIKAFRAKTPYQRFFTLMQCEKDMDRNDMGKLTYLGYAGVVIETVLGLLSIVLVVYLYRMGKAEEGELIFSAWACSGMVWGVFALVIQGVDSVINRLGGF